MNSKESRQESVRQLLTDSRMIVNCYNCRHNSNCVKQDARCLSCVRRSLFELSRLAEAEIENIIELIEELYGKYQ